MSGPNGYTHEHCVGVDGLSVDDRVFGYVLMAKVLGADGSYYWATRKSDDINDMEAYGMAQDMANCFGDALRGSKRPSSE